MSNRIEIPFGVFATTVWGYTFRVNDEPLCAEYARNLAEHLRARVMYTTYEVRGFYWKKPEKKLEKST